MRAYGLPMLTHRKCSELSHGSTQKSKDTMGPYSDNRDVENSIEDRAQDETVCLGLQCRGPLSENSSEVFLWTASLMLLMWEDTEQRRALGHLHSPGPQSKGTQAVLEAPTWVLP